MRCMSNRHGEREKNLQQRINFWCDRLRKQASKHDSDVKSLSSQADGADAPQHTSKAEEEEGLTCSDVSFFVFLGDLDWLRFLFL